MNSTILILFISASLLSFFFVIRGFIKDIIELKAKQESCFPKLTISKIDRQYNEIISFRYQSHKPPPNNKMKPIPSVMSNGVEIIEQQYPAYSTF